MRVENCSNVAAKLRVGDRLLPLQNIISGALSVLDLAAIPAGPESSDSNSNGILEAESYDRFSSDY